MGAGRAAENQSMISKGKGFLSDSVTEIKKVTTPTKQETTQATLVTVVIILFVAFCLCILDLVFNNLMGAVLS
ncbi:preprotein translocase subunit SecE [Oligoflexia bacterium]|nr:preprotein translocase subunit SecE [Oligoflexia bacterium]